MTDAKERPILFSGPMVRALLDGRKTQTRRPVKGLPLMWLDESEFTPEFVADPANRMCPYGVPGDRLWVKETWRPMKSFGPWDMDVTYRADGERRTVKDGEFGDRDWTMPKAAATGNVSPLFMPRWASRLVLEITDVRVERLNAISEADALAEGIARFEGERFFHWEPNPEPQVARFNGVTPEAGFQFLWETINGDDSWDANPWVWAVSFRVLDPDGQCR